MKKLLACTATFLLIANCGLVSADQKCAKCIVEEKAQTEMEQFLLEYRALGLASRGFLEAHKKNFAKFVEIFEAGQKVDVEFQEEALHSVTLAKETMEKFRQLGMSFQDSQDQSIREIACALVQMQDYAITVVTLEGLLISSAKDSLENPEHFDYRKQVCVYRNLLNIQSNHFRELMRLASSKVYEG